MKLWVDDVRPAPEGYMRCMSVNEAKRLIKIREEMDGCDWTLWDGTSVVIHPFELIDLDHDAGDYANDGGDYIRLLDWFEETGRNYPIRIHTMNPVGRENMRRIIQRNGWMEVR